MEISSQQIDKLLYELHRIGNAVETLAVLGDPEFVPVDDVIKAYRLRRQVSTKRPDPQARAKP